MGRDITGGSPHVYEVKSNRSEIHSAAVKIRVAPISAPISHLFRLWAEGMKGPMADAADLRLKYRIWRQELKAARVCLLPSGPFPGPGIWGQSRSRHLVLAPGPGPWARSQSLGPAPGTSLGPGPAPGQAPGSCLGLAPRPRAQKVPK